MSKLIHIGDVSLPLNDFVVARTGVLGITRSGKTYAAKGLAEQLLDHDVPVIISKQSGVAEVLTHALKVDFWDIDEMANKIIAVLRHPPLHATLREHGSFEVRKLTWHDSARRCMEVYEAVGA